MNSIGRLLTKRLRVIVDQLRHQNQALHERLLRLKSEHAESHES
ncbi:MAG: hypothetical protein ETSY2_12030 [Candidatus Entotheonella gemina]|uniref:Uncharacterized protein n=1 Tax=Candidatus Entotheonella gemina TaxID=1429439 RepID=W4MAW2_9BACT|nr:MAG: hypothetical protein ETSY2_12030 [Candidatus Entotheonella gemina]